MTPNKAIIGRALITAEALWREAHDAMMAELDRSGILDQASIESRVRHVAAEFEPLFGSHLTEIELASWLDGFKRVSDVLPGGIRFRPPPIDPPVKWPWEKDEPFVRFPLLEKAAESLEKRGILSRPAFDMVSRDIKARSFTVAGEFTESTLSQVRDALTAEVQTGSSLEGFRERVHEILGPDVLRPAHLENVYRTNIQAAFRDGRETLASDPVVSVVFPYQQYVATHDARTRVEHRAMEKLGLNGTAIYRRDDPVWDLFTPPWDYQCRCGVLLLTVKQAAKAGVREAQEWMETGTPPRVPEFRIDHIGFRPREGFGTRGRVYA